jgi:hypothetical protein
MYIARFEIPERLVRYYYSVCDKNKWEASDTFNPVVPIPKNMYQLDGEMPIAITHEMIVSNGHNVTYKKLGGTLYSDYDRRQFAAGKAVEQISVCDLSFGYTTPITWMKSLTLRDVLPKEALGAEYDAAKFIKYLDTKVIRTYAPNSYSNTYWPGTHKNVTKWWVLENNIAVGWNENPATGWSFPIKRVSQ